MQLFSPSRTLLEHQSRQPEAEAIIIGDLVITYGEFVERVFSFAHWLLERGLAPEEVTGLCIRDEVDHLVCSMSLLCLGTPHISLGSHESDATKRSLARKVGVTQLIIETTHDWMAGLRAIVAPAGNANSIASLGNLNRLCVERSLVSICLYQNTSGSTIVSGLTTTEASRHGRDYFSYAALSKTSPNLYLPRIHKRAFQLVRCDRDSRALAI
jgi:acyl-coenzyme A synthetase/AMP-(fatty) acid ligase